MRRLRATGLLRGALAIYRAWSYEQPCARVERAIFGWFRRVLNPARLALKKKEAQAQEKD